MSRPHGNSKTFIAASMLLLFVSPGAPLAANQYGGLAVGVPYEDIGQAVNAGAAHVIHGSAYGLTSSNSQLWSQGANGIMESPEENDYFGDSLAAGDFNNDGLTDLAIGVPYERVGEMWSAGAVHIIYVSTRWLTSANNQLWSQDSPGIEGVSEAADFFGSSLTAADFNKDGFSDLAIGVPGEDINREIDSGSVNIIYGSAQGLTSDNNHMWSQDSAGIAGGSESGDNFGWSLISGDFNKDGFSDLAIGVPYEGAAGIGKNRASGVVNIIYGSFWGLTSDNNQMWSQDSAGIAGGSENDDWFGSSLTAADFNNDGFSDLAIGVPSEDTSGQNDAGVVNIIFGSAQGLTSANNQVWSQDSAGIAGNSENYDWFGLSLTSADFNKDGFSDLAIGVPGEDIGAIVNAGVVTIIHGSAQGLTSDNNQIWQLGDLVGRATENGDNFGGSLAAGDLNRDGIADLAIGMPGKDFGAVPNVGAVHIIYGTIHGLHRDRTQEWNQNTSGIAGTPEAEDRFGSSLVYIPQDTPFPWSLFLPALFRSRL